MLQSLDPSVIRSKSRPHNRLRRVNSPRAKHAVTWWKAAATFLRMLQIRGRLRRRAFGEDVGKPASHEALCVANGPLGGLISAFNPTSDLRLDLKLARAT